MRPFVNATLAVALSVALAVIFDGAHLGYADGGAAPALDVAELVPTLHRINQMEIDAAEVAERQGESQVVKDYGRELERDHRIADGRLQAYAHAIRLDIGGAVPAAVGRDLDRAKGEMAKLAGARGAAFDHAFAQQMVANHKKAIAIFDRSRTRISNARFGALMDDLKPTLREHERIADNILRGANEPMSAEYGLPNRSAQGRQTITR